MNPKCEMCGDTAVRGLSVSMYSVEYVGQLGNERQKDFCCRSHRVAYVKNGITDSLTDNLIDCLEQTNTYQHRYKVFLTLLKQGVEVDDSLNPLLVIKAYQSIRCLIDMVLSNRRTLEALTLQRYKTLKVVGDAMEKFHRFNYLLDDFCRKIKIINSILLELFCV